MKIGFVFTNYNNTAHTENLLNSLSQVRYIENSHIVIVDNDSDYSNRQNLIRLCEGLSYVSLVLNTENCGYFKGLNKGISFLRDLNPEFDVVVIGNNDLKFNSDFIESVQKNDAILTQYPVISPDIVTADGGHQNPHVIKK
jgi:GT2 family glycosyltransferase